jgi:hypothetical protein
MDIYIQTAYSQKIYAQSHTIPFGCKCTYWSINFLICPLSLDVRTELYGIMGPSETRCKR